MSQAPFLYLLRTYPGETLPNATFCLIPGHRSATSCFLQALQVHPNLGIPQPQYLCPCTSRRCWAHAHRKGVPCTPQILLFVLSINRGAVVAWGGGECVQVLGSPMTALPPRPAASLCSSAPAGSCLSLKSSTGPRQPSLLMRDSRCR